jgi:hypothetical protein
MPTSGLYGPYELTTQNIDAVVRGIGPGAYLLGRLNASGDSFIADYAGRSDDDLNDRLKDWVGGKYPQFKYGFYDSPKAAFEKECHLFHDFGGTTTLDNDIHPARPKGTDWKCPRCNVFD